MLASKVEPFSAPHGKAENKPRDMNNVNPTQDPIMAIAQNFDKVKNKIMHIQATLLNKVTILERERGQQQNFHPRPQYNNNNRQLRGNQGWNRNRPPHEKRVTNSLAPSDTINQE